MVPCPSQCFCLCYSTQVLNPNLITPSLAGVLTFCFKIETEATSSDVPPVITWPPFSPFSFFYLLSLCNHFFFFWFRKRDKLLLTPSASSGSHVFTSWVFVFPPLSTSSARSFFLSYKQTSRASLLVQWLRVDLVMQGTWVWSLVWEDPTCHGATATIAIKSMPCNYWSLCA